MKNIQKINKIADFLNNRYEKVIFPFLDTDTLFLDDDGSLAHGLYCINGNGIQQHWFSSSYVGVYLMINGRSWGVARSLRCNFGIRTIEEYKSNNFTIGVGGMLNGYVLYYSPATDDISVYFWDMGDLVRVWSNGTGQEDWEIKVDDEWLNREQFLLDNFELFRDVVETYMYRPPTFNTLDEIIGGEIDFTEIYTHHFNDVNATEKARALALAYNRLGRIKSGKYEGGLDFVPFLVQLNNLQKEICYENDLPEKIRYIGGANTLYFELEFRLIGIIVVLDADTLEVVDQAYFEEEVTTPFIPGLHAFSEVPVLERAYSMLRIKPDIIICDGHGVSHPQKVGLATHLGLLLNIPTIGFSGNRLIGSCDKSQLGIERGSYCPLIFRNETIGVLLRTFKDSDSFYVSIGHKVSLERAIELVLRFSPDNSMPIPIRQVIKLAGQLGNNRMVLPYPE